MRKRLHAALIPLLLAGLSCLPPDDRPPPGTLQVTVSPSEEVQAGLTTVDGWSISFDRVLVSVGQMALPKDDAEGCTWYYTAGYVRILDVRAGAGQRVSDQFWLGPCNLSFAVRSPDTNARLGTGVTEEDKAWMRTPGVNPFEPEGGAGLIIIGSATKASERKTFRWAGVSRDITCSDEELPGLALAGDEVKTLDIQIDAARIFRDSTDELAFSYRFDSIAEADTVYGNNDGAVSQGELNAVLLSDIAIPGAYDWGDDKGADKASLLDFMVGKLLHTVPRYRGISRCDLSLDSKDVK